MNAKKIMGAVLVAFLAAALFIGAGAAAEDGEDFGTVFIYQKVTGIPTGVWQNGDATVTIETVSGTTYVLPGEKFVAGKYTLNGNTITVVKPTVSYSVYADFNGAKYTVANGGTVYNGSTVVIGVSPLNSTFVKADINYYVTFANGTALNITDQEMDAFFVTDEFEGWQKGTFTIQAFFNNTAKAEFADQVPFSVLLDENIFSFTVVDEDELTVSASADTAFSGDVVKFTLAGAPGTPVTFNLTAFNISLNQKYQVSKDGFNYSIVLDNEGKGVFEAIVNSSLLAKDAKKVAVFKVVDGNKFKKDYEIQIKITAPVISGTVGATSYFIGDNIVISGTSTLEVKAGNTQFNISGINYDTTKLNPVTADCEYGKTWKIVLPTAGAGSGLTKKLDVGTYTISMIQGGEIVATFTVNLKQPFISIISAPEVVAQGTEAEFVINAEATKNSIKAYIFGTNHFAELTDIEQDDKLKNQFTVTMSEKQTEALAAGQYFTVFQHPMYDQQFNVTQTDGKFYQDAEIPAGNGGSKFLFDANDRQTANAAQALCDALDSQNFDDMYVKYSFFIVGEDESFSISEIPTTVAQGETITISGVDTANAGETIQVTMLSTAFAAVPKEDSNSAAFILVTTEIAEDGTWEVTLDTSALAIDEYNLAVKIQGEEADKKNVRVNVVEGADTPDTPDTPDVPDTPDTPDTPTEPTTPGFGALAALAGLGAVAVLLLRRE